MSVLIHGEISADGKNVVIMAAGPDYAVAKEAKKLALITPLVSKSDPPGALLMQLSWPGCVQIAHSFGRAWVPGPKLTKWLLGQVSMRTGYLAKEIRYELPQGVVDLGYSLYPWQIEDIKAIAYCSGALITDDPGTGKTISAIVGLVERELRGLPSVPAVVVCPPSVTDSWVRAFQLWAPHWRTTAWRGTPDKRAALVGHYDIYVTGYPLARRDAAPGVALGKSPLARVHPVSVIADEIQNINNRDAVQTLATQRLVKGAQVFIPMSGTPITHNVKGLLPTLQVMEHGA
ncbi:MAG: SNF2-related protein, partial [Actinomycetota bacterium]|nr:SNF2-related protein [Actinomycetota bacterium]